MNAGENLGHYRILHSLGAGGMGVVYAARDTRLGRLVALKILRPELADDAGRLERFQREAQIVAALNHPNIVTLHSIEKDQDRHFLSMEYVEGRTLAEEIRGGMSLKRFFELASPLADALAAAHRRGVVHRDLKPANIMISADGQVKVLDFGIARLNSRIAENPIPPNAGEFAEEGFSTSISDAAPDLTEPGTLLGTRRYMSPEQAQGLPVDARSDVFSLGGIFFEMLAGEHPFSARSPEGLLLSIVYDPPADSLRKRRDLPPTLQATIERCLEKDPAVRFPDAHQLYDALHHTQKETSAPQGTRRLRAPLLAAAGVLALSLILLWLQDRASPSLERPPPSQQQTAVAVLPFENLSPDPEQAWFADGMTEELISTLIRIEGLQLPAARSSHIVDAKALDLQAAGQLLQVDHVVIGSVRRSEQEIRITAHLVEVESGFYLWSQTWERKLDDLFEVQAEIARAIAGGLAIELAAEERLALSSTVLRPTENLDAYDAYLQARIYWNQRTTEGVQRATELFERAIALDPGLSDAHAGLAAATIHLSNLGVLPLEQAAVKARVAALKAVELDPRSSNAHAELGYYYWTMNDLPSAKVELERAVALEPGNARAHHNLGFVLQSIGEDEAAVASWERARKLDPGVSNHHANLGNAYVGYGQYDLARASFSRLVEFDPDWAFLPRSYGRLAIAERRYDEAIAAMALGDRTERPPSETMLLAEAHHLRGDYAAELRTMRVIPESQDDFGLATRRASALIALGRFAEARKIFDRALALPQTHWVLYFIASEHLVHGAPERARELFALALERPRPNLERTEERAVEILMLEAIGAKEEARDKLRDFLARDEPNLDPGVRTLFSCLLLSLQDEREAGLQTAEAFGLEAQERLDRAGMLQFQALALVALGDRPRAIQALRGALKSGLLYDSWVHSNPLWRDLYEEPAYLNLLREHGLLLPVASVD